MHFAETAIKSGRSSLILCSRFSLVQDGFSAMHCAAQAGRLKVLKVLKELGADLNQKELSGRTAFELAALHGHHKLVGSQHAELWNVQKLGVNEFLRVPICTTSPRATWRSTRGLGGCIGPM